MNLVEGMPEGRAITPWAKLSRLSDGKRPIMQSGTQRELLVAPDREIEVGMSACRLIEEQIQRPTAGDEPFDAMLAELPTQ
jgi:hypothetical protein